MSRLKYLSLFSGIGGFELGIIKAYENSWMERKQRKNNPISGRQKKKHSSGVDTKQTHEQTSDFFKYSPYSTCIGFSEIDKYATQIYQKHFPNHKAYGDITKIQPNTLPDFDLLVGGFPCQAFSIAGKRRGFDDTRGTLFFDIARILKEKRPRNFILENVKGLLSHDNGRTFKTIIATLVELGYCVEWQVLNAKNFGVPQNRERVFIVGHFGEIPKRKVFPIGEINTGIEISRGEKRKEVANTLRAKKGGPDLENSYEIDLKAPGSKTRRGMLSQNNYAKTLDHDCAQGIIKDSVIRKLTPLECERLMGYPDGWTEGLSDTQRYKTLGNGIVSNVVEEVVKRLLI